MRRLYINLALLLTLTVQSSALANDKIGHLAVSSVSTFAIAFALNAFLGGNEPTASALVAASAVTVAGLAMEVGDSIDRGDRRLDAGDLGANVAGAAIAAIAFTIAF